jgi:formylglycine-generating enzyme required for sulfatase activity
MSDRDQTFSDLDSVRWNQLEEMASRLEAAWKLGGPVDLNTILPPEGDPLRSHVLPELVKVDMECRWRRGQPVVLDYYVDKFKELGPHRALSPTLILEEYRVRQCFGDRPPIDLYQQRFPRQFEELRRLVSVQSLKTIAPVETRERTQEKSGTIEIDPKAKTTPGKTAHASYQATEPIAMPGVRAALGDLNNVVLKEFGGHRFMQRLGSGAFGEVWKTEAPGGIFKAIKVIFRPIDHDEARRELEALELIKNLRHHFLLATHQFAAIDDRLFILMDLADASLRDRLKACVNEGKTGIPLPDLIKYLREAAEALDYLHEKGVQHRDVKPENILLCEGNVRVADFGLARTQKTRRLVSGSGAGTPVYMPPECWHDKIHNNSDQYSLAATYVECRRARRLFEVEGLPSLMAAHLSKRPTLEGLTPGEKLVLLKALAKNPEERYPSCVAFAEAIEQAVAPLLPPGTIKSYSTQLGRRGLAPRDRWLIGGGVAAVLIAAITLWSLLMRPGELEVASAQRVVEVAVLDTVRVPIVFNRNRIRDPIALSADPVRGVTVEQPAAEPGSTIELPITVTREATLGDHALTLHAAAGDKTVDLNLTVRVVPLHTLPKAARAGIYMPAADSEIVPGGDKAYYDIIECRLAPPSTQVVRFRFIPVDETGKTPFYMMENKVSNKLYAEFARQNPGAVNGSRWRLGARRTDFEYPAIFPVIAHLATTPWQPNVQALQEQWHTLTDKNARRAQVHWPQPGDWGADQGDWPVFRVDVQEAHACAEWLGGRLPSVEQWDKAAGRFDRKDKGEDPDAGPFVKNFGPDDIAINRQGPMAVGKASHDVGIYRCRDMAGNGMEWTRSLVSGGAASEYFGLTGRVAADAAVQLRGRDFGREEPLRFADLDDTTGRVIQLAFWQSSPTRIFNCSDEQRIGFRVVVR